VRFWDTSALIPLVLGEPGSVQARRWAGGGPRSRGLDPVKALSVIARRRRESRPSARALRAAREELLAGWRHWSEVTAVELIRQHADRIVETHPIRAADALQLGAALVAAGGAPGELAFVTFDRRQAEAAEREWFPVLFPVASG
jgi:predicted nucleic acid-binding protein